MSGTEERSATKDQPSTLSTLAFCLVIAAASWYLLRELVSLLRPLLLAVFLCYVLLPVHQRLKRHVPALVSIAVMVVASAGLLYLIALMTYGSAVELSEELPRMIQRARGFLDGVWAYSTQHLPWLAGLVGEAAPAGAQGTARLHQAANAFAGAAADALTEAIVVGFYSFFLLLDAGNLPRRVRAAFPEDRAEQLLNVGGHISGAIADYLKIKVKASLILAVPVTLLLWVFGVRFPLMWGALTFICNFIPYVGSIISYSLPALFALLLLDPGWQPIAAVVLLLAIRAASAYLIEPTLTGRAVGLSPFIILAALAFWGQCWGLIGMFLAVPLTVTLKIVLENVPFTRPAARLLADE